MLARSLSVKAPQRKSPKKVQNILASASEDSFDNRAHLTGSSVCASMSSSVDSSTSLATTVALTQVGVSVQSFGFQSPVVVSQFSHGPPPLIRASIYLLPPHLVILHHLLILKILLKGLHTVLFKHHQGLTWPSSSYPCICLPLATTSGDLTPSSDTENPSQRSSHCTVQTPPGTHLGPGWMLRPSQTPGT